MDQPFVLLRFRRVPAWSAPVRPVSRAVRLQGDCRVRRFRSQRSNIGSRTGKRGNQRRIINLDVMAQRDDGRAAVRLERYDGFIRPAVVTGNAGEAFFGQEARAGIDDCNSKTQLLGDRLKLLLQRRFVSKTRRSSNVALAGGLTFAEK